MSVNADKLVQIIPRIIEGGTPGLTFARAHPFAVRAFARR